MHGMSTPMTVRLDEDARTRLEQQARLARERPATYASRLIEEGMRTAAHPGVVFRPTPSGGRVAALADGPDVAEVVRILLGLESRGDAKVREAATWLDLPERKVRIALDYYGEFGDEIDQELHDRSEAERRLQEQLMRQHDLLG